ncbi:MAG TPA: GNAT family N-acetyltransferase [Candidatus Saccharimonadales bacterium]|nr:GNAT family N-acetyltransferase [Candidatus Saccharimonadales bacterium]
MYKVTTIKTIDKQFVNDWKQLWQRAENSNIYNSYEWFITCLELGQIGKYEIDVCYDGDRLVAVMPFEKYKCFGVTVYGSVNKDHHIDTPLLIEKYDRILYKRFFEAILKRKNLYFQKIDNEDVKILHKVFPTLFFSLISVNPTIDLRGEVFATVTPSTLSQMKRNVRKNPALNFKVYKGNLDEHMKTMLEIQKHSSKSARNMDIFQDEETKIYYTAILKNFGSVIRLCFLYLGDIPIAYQYGFVCRKTFIGDQIAFHNDYAKLRPGKTLVYHLMQYLKENGMDFIDQGGGVGAYKMEFAKDYRFLYNLYYSNNPFIMMYFKLINKMRRMRQVMFPKKHTRDYEFLFKTL